MRLTDQEVDAIAHMVAAKMESGAGRRPVIAGNWKMHKTPCETGTALQALVPLVSKTACEVVIAPAYPCLDRAARAIAGSNIRLCAQNIHWEPQGAFTGEVSTDMVLDLGVTHVIVGHSERRLFFGETDESVNRRTTVALEKGLAPIVCVGESLAEREAGRAKDVVGAQVRGCLAGLDGNRVSRLMLAYEPVWAIGTGKVAGPQQAQEIHAEIRQLLSSMYGEDVAQAVRILYGGSVKPDNAAALMAEPDVDGALVGGASLKPTDMAAICNAAA